MATKNLARTIVEGGRTGSSKFERKARSQAARKLKLDPEGEYEPQELPDGWGREFADRTTPLTRWLRSNIGRPWAKVYSEFCAKYDQRVTKNWHLKSHLLMEVDTFGKQESKYGFRYGFYVDQTGTLRYQQYHYHWRDRRPPKGQLQEATIWAKGRQVIRHGKALFWTEDSFPLTDRYLEGTKQKIPCFFSRQGRPLGPAQVAYFEALHKDVQQQLTYDPLRVRQLLRELRQPS